MMYFSSGLDNHSISSEFPQIFQCWQKFSAGRNSSHIFMKHRYSDELSNSPLTNTDVAVEISINFSTLFSMGISSKRELKNSKCDPMETPIQW
jgi:hypothetical protein